MKIVHYEAGKKLYGGAYQVVGLLERLQAGAHHHLFCARESAIAAAVEGLAEVHHVPLAGDLDPRPFLALKRLLRAERPDLLHVHSRRGADLWGPMAARATGTPFLVSRRVDNPEPGWLLRRKLRGAARVIGISEKICGVLCSLGLPPGQVVCIRSGVDVQRYQPRLKTGLLHRALKVREDALLVGMAAQFIPRKGHDDLVAAVPNLLAAHPHTVFVLFGQGSLRESIKARVGQLGMASNFRFPGFRDDLPRLLPELDLFVHPAHLEGLGVAILQASACGLPVVATRAGGIPEIVRDGETGFLVKPASPAALATRLSQLLGDPVLRHTLGAGGRDFVVRECSLEATAAGNGALYLEVIRAARAANP
jgi:glycosyltransferase involved in cell wall biosynthesis